MFFVVISPAHRRGERICGQFVASLDGRRLCVSHEPLLASARVLLAEGVDPETRIAIRHTGKFEIFKEAEASEREIIMRLVNGMDVEDAP